MSVWWEECIARHAFDGEHNVKFFKLRFLYSFEMANRERAEQEREGVSGLESDQFIYIAQSAKHYSYGNLLIIISLLRFFFQFCYLSPFIRSLFHSEFCSFLRFYCVSSCLSYCLKTEFVNFVYRISYSYTVTNIHKHNLAATKWFTGMSETGTQIYGREQFFPKSSLLFHILRFNAQKSHFMATIEFRLC